MWKIPNYLKKNSRINVSLTRSKEIQFIKITYVSISYKFTKKEIKIKYHLKLQK